MDQSRNDDPRKRHWQRKMLNRVLERADRSLLRTGTFMYLPGESDHDRKVILQKGVPEHRLMCVERDKRIGMSLRSARKNVVIDDLVSAVAAHGSPISVLWADLCCTLHGAPAWNLMMSLAASPSITAESVVMINVMRGRDAGASRAIRNLVDLGWVPLSHQKNRAVGLIAAWLYDAMLTLKASGAPDDFVQEWGKRELASLNAYAAEYKNKKQSSVVVMDSICFTPSPLMTRFRLSAEELVDRGFTSKKRLRQMAAAKAVMTMRREGTLPRLA